MRKKEDKRSDIINVSVLALATIFLSALLIIKLLENAGVDFKNLSKPPKSSDSSQINYSLEIPIITYHYVEVVTDKRDFLRKNMAISPAELKKEIEDLRNQGYQFIFINEIPKLLNMKMVPTGKYVAITFDDGYRDFYTDAFSIIKQTGVKATIFVISGFINYQNYMTDQQIKEIAHSGLVEIGAHTIHHVDIKSVTPAEAENEVVGSKTYLETKYGIKVESFAYPYGAFDDKIVQIVKNASFTSAVSDISGTTQSQSNLYSLSRIRVGYYFKFQ
jgi:peptidoglycan/xylan/chitin deacetylase (PgdA/CDA1 family)